MMPNNLKAFTLLETVITLGICCGILLIGSLQLTRYQQRLLFDNTIKEVTATLDHASRISTIKGEATTVRFIKSRHCINLDGGNFQQSAGKQIDLDRNINIRGLDNFVISSRGRSNPRTVIFAGYGLKKEIKYQMLWGRIS